ncbi:P-II family nitrogen regulator [Arthrobacter sp. H-02-3]|uniref:P-II family nitrogen regulator n=1 Tax=Arthrobacter sp. H-02-3 TaxID=2703675 RepID=UPI000DD26177|nr:P-II family nitrogen regulator [Arthrobacter sp. H-02-3]PVZ52778.1 transcriptional regulator [Arthrobacter sp. H-02-3]
MKLVTAIVRPERVNAISTALERFGVNGLTVSQASGYGRQRGHTEVYRGAEYNSDLLPKVRLEVLANEDALRGVMAAIEEGGRTGHFGDGKIWIIEVHDAVRVRTGERGASAIA